MKRETKTICLVSPFPPPNGGMAIQATKLIALLEQAGYSVIPVRTNADFPPSLLFIKKIPFLRTLVNSILFFLRLHSAARSSDVVYFLTGFFNFFFWITYPALILCKIARIPVILSARGGGAADFFARWKILLKPIMLRIDLVTTPSGFLQNAFVDAFNICPVIVPNIADVEQFTYRQRVHLSPKLIVTRSLEDIYNVGCVLRAFRIVKDSFPEATLAVVGDGSERRMLENLAHELDISVAVTFHGRIAHDCIQTLYDENDISVNASNVDNLPGTILEAYACGLPIVTTHAGGIPFIVEDGVTGFLVECNDYEALASQVIALLRDPQLALTLSNNGRKECDKYSVSSVREALVPLLEQVTGERVRR